MHQPRSSRKCEAVVAVLLAPAGGGKTLLLFNVVQVLNEDPGASGPFVGAETKRWRSLSASGSFWRRESRPSTSSSAFTCLVAPFSSGISAAAEKPKALSSTRLALTETRADARRTRSSCRRGAPPRGRILASIGLAELGAAEPSLLFLGDASQRRRRCSPESALARGTATGAGCCRGDASSGPLDERIVAGAAAFQLEAGARPRRRPRSVGGPLGGEVFTSSRRRCGRDPCAPRSSRALGGHPAPARGFRGLDDRVAVVGPE